MTEENKPKRQQPVRAFGEQEPTSLEWRMLQAGYTHEQIAEHHRRNKPGLDALMETLDRNRTPEQEAKQGSIIREMMDHTDPWKFTYSPYSRVASPLGDKRPLNLIPGVSPDTLALIHRQEAWPIESSADEFTTRLEERKRIINEYALLDPFHAKLYPRRIKFVPGFIETLEDHLADIERMRLRKRANRRKTTKKRKQRLMGKR